MDRRALAARAMSGQSFRFRGAHFAQSEKRRLSDENRRLNCPSWSRLPAIIRHAELQSPRALFLFPNACTTNLLPRQRIRLALRSVQPARIRVRQALRSRGVRTPVSRSAARTRPDGATTMGHERFSRSGLGGRRQGRIAMRSVFYIERRILL